MFKKVTVTGDGGEEAPTADATVTAKDYSFELDGLKAGDQTIVFTNDGPEQWHFADISVFPKGTTDAQATTVFRSCSPRKARRPPGVPAPDEVGASQVASPGYG